MIIKIIYKLTLISLPILFLFNCVVKVFPENMFKQDYLIENTISGVDKDKIVVISIDGVISDTRRENILGVQSESMLSFINEQLKKSAFDPDVKGILLKINSPGGTVTASDIIYRQIQKFKLKKQIPVHSLFMDTSTSGAYYIAMATDHITAHPTTITGSIGVIMMGLNFSETMKKIGVQNQTITSGTNKAIGSPLEPINTEHKEILQNIINDLFTSFYNVVKTGRPQINDIKLKSLADGRIFTATQAKQAGLIDKIGYFDDSIEILMKDRKYNKLKDNDHPRIILYTYSKNNPKNIYNAIKTDSWNAFNKMILANDLTGFLYLWNAGL